MRIACALLVAGALLLAGCGGDDNGGSGADTATTTAQSSTQESTGGGAQADAAGKQIFTQNCGGCHVLADAGTSGQVGPNLDELKPDQSTVQRQVTNGGGRMPAFKGRLSAQEIQSVATYVSSVAGKS
jgi:mono/diheme cytochrome c family protein